MKPQKFQRFQIPPNFQLAQIHRQACYPYQNSLSTKQCPCCHRSIGQDRIAFCSSLTKLAKIGEQIPVFFYFVRGIVLLIFFGVFYFGVQFAILHDQNNQVYVQLPESLQKMKIPVGFKSSNDAIFFGEMIFGIIILLLFKIYVKWKKYISKRKNTSLSKLSLMLINLHKKSTSREVSDMFNQYQIVVSNVVFTYKVNQYHQSLKNISEMKKKLIIQQKYHKMKGQQKETLEKKVNEQIIKCRKIKSKIINNQNRLSIAFVEFRNEADRNYALNFFKIGLCQKLCLKFCTCISKSSIRGQHISMESAPDPEDINWQNLQNPYLRTKLLTVASYFICFALIGAGIFFEPFISAISNQQDNSNFYLQLVRTFSVLVVNFIIVTFIEWSSTKFQKYRTRSDKIWTLINKMTFFLFFNISITPMLIFAYNETNQTSPQKSQINLNSMVFSIITIAIGNISKPLITYFAIQRFTKWFKQKLQKYRGNSSMLYQMQANQLFQPLQFPIEIYYSLILSSVLMCFFYSSLIQSLYLLELFGLLFVYLGAKMMIVRVCKQPLGLSLKISNLAQSITRVIPFVSCFGRNSIYYILQKNNSDTNYFIYMFWRNGNAFVIITWILSIGMLFSEDFVAYIGRKIQAYSRNDESDYEPLVRDSNRLTYEQANLIDKLQNQLF